MKTFAIDGPNAQILGLLALIKAGEEVALTEGNTVLAKIVPTKAPVKKKGPRIPGTLKGIWMAPDFDAPLDEFKEYTE